MTFHRFDPQTCRTAHSRKLAASLVAGFAAGLLVASAAVALMRPFGDVVAALDPPGRAALANEWSQARLHVASESFVRRP
ncbi:MAG: hypothetical protein QNK04_00280 [Myxococcota bacterium]|nr:hypothetical protein [Myxococcota bacterium]